MENQKTDAIRLGGVSVRYRLPGEQIHTFKEYAIRLIQGKIQFKRI